MKRLCTNCGGLAFYSLWCRSGAALSRRPFPLIPPVRVLLVASKSFVNVVLLWYLKLLQTDRLCGGYNHIMLIIMPNWADTILPFPWTLSPPLCYIYCILFRCGFLQWQASKSLCLRIYLASVINSNRDENKTILTSLWLSLCQWKRKSCQNISFPRRWEALQDGRKAYLIT